jgi:hypothetical protein
VSIAAIVDRMGKTLYIWRPTITRLGDGRVVRTYAKVTEAKFFVQPSGQTGDVFEGRANTRTNGTMYAAGVLDVRIDDEIRSVASGTGRVWRVVGTLNPGEQGATSALSMTAVDVVEVEPDA